MDTNKIREALELAEAMADVFDQLSQKLGDLRERNTDRSRLEEIREALAELDKAQQPAEPVAWMVDAGGGMVFTDRQEAATYCDDDEDPTPLYTHQAQAQQPGKVLTDDEIDIIADTTPPPSRANSYAEYCAEEAGFVRGLRYARDNGYLAPAAGLTVDEVMEAIEDDIGSESMIRLFRARLTDALAAKTRTA